MKSNDKIQEEYEDALFALLMDAHSEAAGQRLMEENERLNAEAATETTDAFEKRCMETINEYFDRQHRKQMGRMTLRILSRVAVIVLAVGITFTVLFTTVSAFREAVYSLFTVSEEVNTDARLNDDSGTTAFSSGGKEGTGDTIPTGKYAPSWIPEGYSLYSFVDTDGRVTIIYSDMNGNVIRYNELSDIQNAGVDTENSDAMVDVIIGEYSGVFVAKGQWQSITWGDTNRKVLLRVSGTSIIDKNTLIKIAESVKIVN